MIGFDLFGEAVTWDVLPDAATTILFVTHGHPEHCGALRQFQSAEDVRLDRAHIISSPAIIVHVIREIQIPVANVYPIETSGALVVAGVQVTAFAWNHMPLLPPGLSRKIDYAAHVLHHPIEFARVGASGLRLP